MVDSGFTAVIPAFNAQLFIARAIDSVLSQTIRPKQMIVVDDGSTDDTATVIRQYAADGVEYVYQGNAGAASARNTGIRIAEGQYVGFLDADDEWKKYLVEDIKNVFDRYPNLAWATTPYLRLFENGRIEYVRSVSTEMSKNGIIKDYFAAQAKFEFSISSNMFVKRSVFESVGYFDTAISQYGEDLDMWFRIALQYPVIGYAERAGGVYWARPGSAMHEDPRDVAHHLSRIRKAEGHAILAGNAAATRSEPLVLNWIWAQIKDAADSGNKSALDYISRYYGRRLPMRHRLVLDLSRLLPFKSLWGPARRAMSRSRAPIESSDESPR